MNNHNLPVYLPLTEAALSALRKTRGWVQFLGVIAVLGAILCGLLLLVGIGLVAFKGMTALPLLILFQALIALVIAIVFAVFWLRYSGALKNVGLEGGRIDTTVEDALVRQRKLWIAQGVTFIVLLVLGLAVTVATRLDPNLFTLK